MDDKQIIALFLSRSESAIRETQRRYGGYCFRIAGNILGDRSDAEECVSDALHTAWTKIPPLIPASLKAFLGKLVRDNALSRYRRIHAQKRGGMSVLLDELAECLPSGMDVEQQLEQDQMTAAINEWLTALPQADRVMFVRRYYYGDSVKALAQTSGITQNQMAQRMHRLRKSLREALAKEGIEI